VIAALLIAALSPAARRAPVLCPQARRLLTVAAPLVFAANLFGCAPIEAASPPSPEPAGAASLEDLINTYLATDSTEAADRALATILRDPLVTVSAVEAAMKPARPPAMPSVGSQPEQPLMVKGRRYAYGLYVPPSYRPEQAYPLVVCLHGAGFDGNTYLERWSPRLGDRYILACPSLPHADWWSRSAEHLVLATIRAVQSRYHIDPDRIFLTGMSNGGIGTYVIGANQAPLFAGLAPMAGGVDEVLMPFLQNLKHTPVYLLHGVLDQVMPVQMSRTVAAELTRLGYPHEYHEHERVHPQAGGHFFPREELPALVRWFDGRRRTALPTSLVVVRDASHLDPFAWVRIDATDRIAFFTERLIDSHDELIANRVYARIEASLTAPNELTVRTTRVHRYTVFLNSAMVDFAKPVTIVTNDRLSFTGIVTPSVERLLRESRLRHDRRTLYPAAVTISLEGTGTP
jgi:predicted esterase